MANFQLSLTDPVTEQPDITISSGHLLLVDHSNYATSNEAGHELTDFVGFYKVLITSPSGSEVLYSSIGDGDEVVSVPSAGNPEVDNIYVGGDGQYFVTVYAVPTYDAVETYVYSTTNPVYVYDNEKIYMCIQTGYGRMGNASYWTEVTDIDTLPSKYRLNLRVVIYADSKRAYARRIYNANCVNNLIGENWEKLLRDIEFIAAVKLFVGINTIPVLIEASRFNDIDITINNMKQISATYETL